MRFKSGRSSPAHFFEPTGVRKAAPWVLASAAAFFPISSANATLSFDAVSPYTLIDDTAIHYSADPEFDSSSGLIDTDKDFQNFDFTSTADAGDNSVVVELDSDTTFTEETGERLVVEVFADTQNDGDPVAVPIQAVDGTTCSSSNCSVTSEVDGVTYYLAGHSNESTAISTLQISLNPRAICQEVYAQSPDTPAVGCTDGEVETTTSTNAVTFRLTFAVGLVDETSPEEVFALADAEESSSTLKLVFHAKEPTFSCPTSDPFYFPGDEQIRLSTSFSTDDTTSDAPMDKLIVVGEKGAVPDTSSSWASVNTIVERLSLASGVQTVDGFDNTTDGSDNSYSLRFSVRDVTGRMAAFPSSGCVLDNVQTSEVEGYLSKSKCFIATAAFRDGDAAPVRWLRHFRDTVLERSVAGRWFVARYYAWSPGAAEWLLSHPLFRIPVLAALLPVAPLAGLLAFSLALASSLSWATVAGLMAWVGCAGLAAWKLRPRLRRSGARNEGAS